MAKAQIEQGRNETAHRAAKGGCLGGVGGSGDSVYRVGSRIELSETAKSERPSRPLEEK